MIIDLFIKLIYKKCANRFVNVVEKSDYTENQIWEKIKCIQFERKNSKRSQDECKSISCNVEKLSQLLGIKNNTDEVNEEFSMSTIKSPYKMFLTLIEPSYFERLYSETIYGPQSQG